jgi:hypothetical protein
MIIYTSYVKLTYPNNILKNHNLNPTYIINTSQLLKTGSCEL